MVITHEDELKSVEAFLEQEGLEITICEHFGSKMDRTGLMPVQVEVDMNAVAEVLKDNGNTDKEIVKYLLELQNCDEKEIYVDACDYPMGSGNLIITFQDETVIEI